uniref:RNB domain-containing protein n=1 Tax=Candidozyma auris TaxID=498019 RepID=A0A0L0NSC6_CANAR
MLRSAHVVLRRYRSTSGGLKHKRSPKALSKEAIAVTKEVIEENSTKKYYDPSNVTLDFSLSNLQLVAKIVDASNDRVAKRLEEPAKEWSKKHPIDMEDTLRRFRKMIFGGRISLKKNLSPLDVGDLVLLDRQSTLLHLVVDKPHDLKTSTYTLVNHEGEIMYAHRDQIKLRLPEVVSRTRLRPLQIVQLEKKHRGLAPIGMPDSKFSRSPEALPEGLEMGSTKSESQTSDLERLTTGDDFIMAQAASQLLTDTDVKTYVVPTPARLLISQPLIDTSIASFRKMNSFTRCLDYIHKILQYDENNNITASSRTIPIFELFEYVSKFEHRFKHLEHSDGQDEFRILNSQLGYSGIDGATLLGKKFPDLSKNDFADVDHSLSSYLGFVVSLSQNPRKWKINFHHNSKVPLSVDVLPISKSIEVADTLEFLKDDGINAFTQFYVAYCHNKRNLSKPPQYNELVNLLRDFVAGNIVEDRMLESVVSNLVRSIDDVLEKEGLKTKEVLPYSFEYSKSRALEILSTLNNDLWCNPSQWSVSLNLPTTDTSAEADMAKKYYDFVDEKFTSKEDFDKALSCNFIQDEERDIHLQEFNDEIISTNKTSSFESWITSDFHKSDPLQSIRADFPAVPIYCIDSADAHEIDDGISIEDKGRYFRFTVHVADPTSYIKQNSILSQVALKKGATVYLPEGATLMLPQLISKVCGMDAAGENRSFAIQFKVEKSAFKRYEESHSELDGKCIMDEIVSSARVKFFNFKDNAVCITYEQVNQILDDETNMRRFSKDEFEVGSREWDLFNLSRIASILKEIRGEHLGALDFPNESCKTKVDYVPRKEVCEPFFQKTEEGFKIAIVNGDADKIPVVSIQKDLNQSDSSKSQELVSNFMITANHAASAYARKREIPIILRTQELRLSNAVSREINEIMKRHRDKDGAAMTVQEKADLGKFMTAANYEANYRGHESLGLPSYSHFTSPLRRYADMVNHWMCADYLVNKGEMKMKKDNLFNLANHLQICLFVNKQAERSSIKFWQGSFLRFYFESLKKGKISDPIEFEFLLLSDAKRGDVRCKLAYFDLVKATIVANDLVKRRFNTGEYEVGQVIKPSFTVRKIDMIENEFAVELECT